MPRGHPERSGSGHPERREGSAPAGHPERSEGSAVALPFKVRLAGLITRAVRTLLAPANWVMLAANRRPRHPRSVLHISYMVHVPYNLTRILRQKGMRADYMAVGSSAAWDKADFHAPGGLGPIRQPIQEFLTFWNVVARYEAVHLHFGITMSESGWELKWLRWLGRRIVVHYRGCEARDRTKNMALHPLGNICEQCDYSPRICETPGVRTRTERANRYGDAFLVTTPDMLDFMPKAEWLPFFSVDAQDGRSLPVLAERSAPGARRRFKIVHATNHPGIEGTERIRRAVEDVRSRGHAIDFVCLHGASPDEVLRETASADLTIGKMKMGYYANAQIESLALGVPAITYVRPEFRSEELEKSGLILTTLDELADTLEYYLRNPAALAAKRALARDSVGRLHDNDRLAARLMSVYGTAAPTT
jgi:hypothetical protein